MQSYSSSETKSKQAFIANTERHKDQEEQAKKKHSAKKTGKPISSAPPDPKEFSNQYEKTLERNKEIDWLNSEEMYYKEPTRKKQQKKQQKNTSSCQMPPFWKTAQDKNPTLTNLQGSAANQAEHNVIPQNKGIKQQAYPPIASLQMTNYSDSLKKAQDKMNKIYAKRADNASNEKKQCCNSKQKKKDLTPPSGRDPSFKQSDPFIGINNLQPKLISFDSNRPVFPVNQNEKIMVNNIQQQNSNQPQKTFPQPINNLPYVQPTFASNPKQISPIKNQLLSKGNSHQNSLSIAANLIPIQNQTPQIQQPINSNNFNNNPASIQHNYITNVPVNNLQRSQVTSNYISYSQNNYHQMNYAPVNHIYQNNPQNNYYFGNTYPHQNMNSYPLSNNHMPDNNIQQTNWISQYTNNELWNHYRRKIEHKMKDKAGMNDQMLDILTVMTFQSVPHLKIEQIQKLYDEIMLLGVNYQDVRNNQHQLVRIIRHETQDNQQQRTETGFQLKNYLKAFVQRLPRAHSSYNQQEIQALVEDCEVMEHFASIKDRSVGQFLKEYRSFQDSSTEEIKKITQMTLMTFKRKSKLERLLEDCKKEQKNVQSFDQNVLDKIQERQQQLFDFLGRLASRLGIDQNFLPKSQLNYELQDLKALQKEEKHLCKQVQEWRTLLEESKNAEPYKQVADTLCTYTSKLATRVQTIEEDLIPAFEKKFNNQA